MVIQRILCCLHGRCHVGRSGAVRYLGDVSIALSIAGLIEPPMLGNLSHQSVPIGQFSRGHIKEFKYGAALLKRSIYPSVPFQT